MTFSGILMESVGTGNFPRPGAYSVEFLWNGIGMVGLCMGLFGGYIHVVSCNVSL